MSSMDKKTDVEQILEHGTDHVTFSAAVTTKAMQAMDRVLVVNSAGAVGAVTLPPVAEAAGKIYVVKDDGAWVSAVTIDDAGDDDLQSQATTTKANGVIVYYSDGQRWYVLLTDL